MGITRQDRELLARWNDVVRRYPNQSDKWQMQMALDQFNAANPNNPADVSDLIEALEKSGDE